MFRTLQEVVVINTFSMVTEYYHGFDAGEGENLFAIRMTSSCGTIADERLLHNQSTVSFSFSDS